MEMERVIKAWECCNPFNRKCKECPYEKDCYHDGISRHMVADAVALLKEQEELLRKLQKDKDKLCLEISGWKHKFHDAPPKFVSQGVVDQIRWERDTALSQLEQIGKGLGSKMDDIVALLKEQEAKNVVNMTLSKDCFLIASCPKCNALLTRVEHKNYCGYCGQAVKWK